MKKLGYENVEIDRLGNVIGTIPGARSGLTIIFDGQTGLPTLRNYYSAPRPMGG